MIPGFANGAAFAQLGGKTYLAVTTSRGRYFDSSVYYYEVHKDSCTGKNVYYSYRSDKFPPMAEEMICDGESTYFHLKTSQPSLFADSVGIGSHPQLIVIPGHKRSNYAAGHILVIFQKFKAAFP